MTDRTTIELDVQAAHEAIRSINHATIFNGDGIPCSGRLSGARLPSERRRRRARPGARPARSRAGAITVDLHRLRGRRTRPGRLRRARRQLNRGSHRVALRVGPLLDDAQAAIPRQGYRAAGLTEAE